MVDPVSTAVGGILGAIIGVLWSDPHRNSRGRYTTHARGYQNWWLQAVMGAFIGAALTSIVVPLLVLNPLPGLLALIAVSYVIYVKSVDPR